jgi:hypothetical protein
MNSVELVAAIRTRMDDLVAPYRVSTETILEQVSLTQTEFARATLVLYSIVDDVDVEADNPWLEIPSNVCVVKTVILNGQQLRPISLSELDFGYYTSNGVENSKRFGNWRAATGVPKFIVTDMYADKVRFVPYPIVDGTATIEAYVIPAALTISGTPVNPEIPEVYHELLLAGTLVRLFALYDVDTINTNVAQIYNSQWQRGLVEAQNTLRTALRRQARVMELPRSFIFDSPLKVESNNESQATA